MTTATNTRLQEIADEFTHLENNPEDAAPAHPVPHPDCRAPHSPVKALSDRDARLAMLGKQRAHELFTMQVDPNDQALHRATLKRMYAVCFGLDDVTIEAVLKSRGF